MIRGVKEGVIRGVKEMFEPTFEGAPKKLEQLHRKLKQTFKTSAKDKLPNMIAAHPKMAGNEDLQQVLEDLLHPDPSKRNSASGVRSAGWVGGVKTKRGLAKAQSDINKKIAAEVDKFAKLSGVLSLQLKDAHDGSIYYEHVKTGLQMLLNQETDTVKTLEGILSVEAKFSSNHLRLGDPNFAAAGIAPFLGLPEIVLKERLAKGKNAILEEFQNASADDRENLQYCLNERAGTSSKRFSNGERDQGRNGETLKDFVKKRESVNAELTDAHVLALRLYTTSVYTSLNAPLRDLEKCKRDGHPFPCTVAFCDEAIRRLRKNSQQGTSEQVLWRGLRNLELEAGFMETGGSEPAFMSTSSDPLVAIEYSATRGRSLLLRLVVPDFLHCGADIKFLSAFPTESEYLYPPLTYLKSTGRLERNIKVTLPSKRRLTIDVVEILPTYPG